MSSSKKVDINSVVRQFAFLGSLSLIIFVFVFYTLVLFYTVIIMYSVDFIEQFTPWLQVYFINIKFLPFHLVISPSPPLDYIRIMVIVWRLRGNIIRTALCWIV